MEREGRFASGRGGSVTRYADITFRPIDVWPGEMTRNRRRAPFRTNWGITLKLLERELSMLNARLVVFQIAVDERDLRIDGKPRAQALRKVDRYGVTKRGEQYTGWRALPASTDPADAIQTREQAHDYLDQRWGGDVKKALMETHPDRGGDPDEFRRVVRAKELMA
jgi:hypothetical protein